MRFLVAFLCVVSAVFGGDLTINKSFSLEGKLKPVMLFSYIRIESSDALRNIGELSEANRAKITSSLNAIIKESAKSDICKGGSYAINPIISYDKNKRKTIGQDVHFSLECKFQNTDDYNKILSKVNKIVMNNDLLVLPQPALEYRITNEEIVSKKEELFVEFLSSLSEITERYSKSTNKKCVISEINAEDSYALRPLPRLMTAKASDTMEVQATNTIEPIADESGVNLNVRLKILCGD